MALEVGSEAALPCVVEELGVVGKELGYVEAVIAPGCSVGC